MKPIGKTTSSVQIYRAKTQRKVYDLTEDLFFCKSFGILG